MSLPRRNTTIARTLDDHPSSLDLHDRHQNIRRRSYIDRATLASQRSEGRFRAKHSRKSWESHIQPKKLKNAKTKSCMCTCCTTDAPPCCFPKELEVIDEDQEPEERFARQCEQAREPLFGAFNPSVPSHPCPEFNTSCEEEGRYIDFFDIMRDTIENAVKKSIENMLGPFLEKIDNLAHQVQHNDCILTKIYTDLNEKISYYGERNAQQFQYLCMRMEHDRLFYQQQQEHFLKVRNRPSTSPKRQKSSEEHEPNEGQYSLKDEYKMPADGEDSGDDRRPLEKGGLESSKSRLRLPESAVESLRQNRSQISTTSSKKSLNR